MSSMKIASTAGWVAVAALALSVTELRAEEALEGFWMDSDGEVILEVGPCGDAKCARVAWLKKPNGPDGKPLLDYRNSDPRSAVAACVRTRGDHRLQEAAGRYLG